MASGTKSLGNDFHHHHHRGHKLIQPIHDRMPVILSDRAADDWMNPNEADPLALKRLLVPAPDDLLVITPASPLVNSVRNEGPELLRGGAHSH